MRIKVYSKKNCGQCNLTYRALDALGFVYDVIDVGEDAAALDSIKALGYLQAPVVVAEDEHWSGFRPDRIDSLAKRLMDEVHAERAARR